MRGNIPHVVLIEDDPLVRKLLERRLREAGWQVTALADGRQLTDHLTAHATDLVVIDLGLPHLDGLAVIENMRARGSQVPVMVLTAYDLPHLDVTVEAAGGNDIVQKPYDQEELIQRMHRLLAA